MWESLHLLLIELGAGILATARRSARRAVSRRRSTSRLAGFEYDAGLWFAEADGPFVHRALLPRLRTAGLSIATPSDLELGVPRPLARERLLNRCRRLVLVLGKAKVSDVLGDDAILQRTDADVYAERYSVLPIYLEGREATQELPSWLGSMHSISLNMASYEEGLGTLIRTLNEEVPGREG